jgi:hypothetical protein
MTRARRCRSSLAAVVGASELIRGVVCCAGRMESGGRVRRSGRPLASPSGDRPGAARRRIRAEGGLLRWEDGVRGARSLVPGRSLASPSGDRPGAARWRIREGGVGGRVRRPGPGSAPRVTLGGSSGRGTLAHPGGRGRGRVRRPGPGSAPRGIPGDGPGAAVRGTWDGPEDGHSTGWNTVRVRIFAAIRQEGGQERPGAAAWRRGGHGM